MADLEVWHGEQQGAGLSGMQTFMLDPVWRLNQTSEEPGPGGAKSGSLPDSSQLLNCILETSVDTDSVLQLWQ